MGEIKEINIDVYGEIGCGKTTTALLIEKYFKNLGAYVKTQETMDGVDPKHLEKNLIQSRKHIESIFTNSNPFWGRRININIKNDENKKEKEETTEFSIGDVVVVKGQSIPMTIEILVNDIATCIWFDESKILKRQTFHLEILQHSKI